MEQKKKNEEVSAEERLQNILDTLAQQGADKEEAILQAVRMLDDDTGIKQARSLLLEMFLKFTAERSNGVEDGEITEMLQIFEVFNVA